MLMELSVKIMPLKSIEVGNFCFSVSNDKKATIYKHTGVWEY